jgi:hypothetical protein
MIVPIDIPSPFLHFGGTLGAVRLARRWLIDYPARGFDAMIAAVRVAAYAYALGLASLAIVALVTSALWALLWSAGVRLP